jgi:hypothetical protein
LKSVRDDGFIFEGHFGKAAGGSQKFSEPGGVYRPVIFRNHNSLGWYLAKHAIMMTLPWKESNAQACQTR